MKFSLAIWDISSSYYFKTFTENSVTNNRTVYIYIFLDMIGQGNRTKLLYVNHVWML